MVRILEGDVVEMLRRLEESSVDAIVTDPPYGLEFMGKEWDAPWRAGTKGLGTEGLGTRKSDHRQVFDGTLKTNDTPQGRSRVRSGNGASYKAAAETMQELQEWHYSWAQEALRVLKPGGHLLAFGGSRTYHRLASAIEDAGFEIRDQIMWIYGSGFPKSLDVSKAIDKAARGVPQGGADPTSPNHGKFKGGCSEENPSGRGFGAGPGQFMRKVDEATGREILGVSPNWRESKRDREKNGSMEVRGENAGLLTGPPITHAARQWSGWGTALKPAHEPIVVARKPLVGTVAANVLEHGTGALNIDGCRVEYEEDCRLLKGGSYGGNRLGAAGNSVFGTGGGEVKYGGVPQGRWPANVIHDGSEEVVSLFPQTASGAMQREVEGYEGDSATTFLRGRSGPQNQHGDSGSAARFFYQVKAVDSEQWSVNSEGPKGGGVSEAGGFNARQGEASAERTYEDRGGTSFTLKPGARRFDSGSPARFFYCAKADREERNRGCEELDSKPLLWSAGTQSPRTFQREGVDRSAKNNHPTVKPVALMAYLCRLVTPPGGTVLDCFMGSGSTGIAALREGFNFIGIEVNPAYVEIARMRIEGDRPLFNSGQQTVDSQQ